MNGHAAFPRNITLAALVFEAGLGGVALIIGWMVGYWPLASIEFRREALPEHAMAAAWGAAATLPLLAALLLVDRFPIGGLRRLKQFVEEHLTPLFSQLTIAELALISLAAGIGEEMLFRGLMQAAIADWIGGPQGAWLGLLAAAVAFGVCHWLTSAYAALAALIGLYFGWLFMATENLLAPIAAHALYDFAALLYLAKWKRPRQIRPRA